MALSMQAGINGSVDDVLDPELQRLGQRLQRGQPRIDLAAFDVADRRRPNARRFRQLRLSQADRLAPGRERVERSVPNLFGKLGRHGGSSLVGDDGLFGYVLSHPWRDRSPPPLDAVLAPMAVPSTYYIHDLALRRHTRGSGAGSAIVRTLAAHARALGLPNMTLVAVNNSVHFWQRQGFTVTHDPALDSKLASYGEHARFMTRDLS